MNWVEKQIRKTGWKRLILAAVILMMMMGLLAVATSRYFSNFFRGPQTITKAELDQVHDVGDLQHYWVTINADELINTEFREITVHTNHGIETNREVTANYYAARIGDRMLAIKVRNGAPTHTLTGALLRQSGKVDEEFFNSPSVQAHKDVFYPGIVLDTEDFRTNGEIGLLVAVAALAAVGWLVWTGLSWIRNPQHQKPFKQVEAWGDVDKIAERIELEMMSTKAIRFSNTVITPSFIVARTIYNMKLMRTDQLIWVYQRVTKRKMYFVTVGKNHALSVNTDKDSLMIHGKAKLVTQAIQQLATQKPWIIYGYSEELKKIYKQQREQMLKEIATRKEKAAASAAAKAA